VFTSAYVANDTTHDKLLMRSDCFDVTNNLDQKGLAAPFAQNGTKWGDTAPSVFKLMAVGH
jgi:hypothetical protein